MQLIFICYSTIVVCTDKPRTFTVIPIYGVSQQPQTLAFIQRMKNVDASADGTCATLHASLISDIEHPRSRNAERNAPQEHQIEMQKVRMGEQHCYTKHDHTGGEMHVAQLNHIDSSQLSCGEEISELKNLIKRTLGRYYDESSDNNFAVAILKSATTFDEVAKMFIDCRTVIGLSSRMPRTPHTAYIILDQEVSLDDFLKEAWSRIIGAYHRRLKEIEEKAPVSEYARSIYQRGVANIQRQLKRDVNCALITIDDAQELLRRGHQPVFVSYQRDSIV